MDESYEVDTDVGVFWELSDALAVSEPLSEITDLAYVIGFFAPRVKSDDQEVSHSAPNDFSTG